MSINTTSSIAAELWVLRDGLHLCVNAHIQAVEIELDASTAISLLASNISSNGDLSGLIDDCRELLLQLPQAKLSHVFREANFCADALTRMGSAVPNFNSHFASPLTVLSAFYWLIQWECIGLEYVMLLLMYLVLSF